MKHSDTTGSERENASSPQPLQPRGKHSKGRHENAAAQSEQTSRMPAAPTAQMSPVPPASTGRIPAMPPVSAHPGNAAGLGRASYAHEGFGNSHPIKPRSSRKPLIIVGAVLALLLAVYVGVAIYFTAHFMPNTKIGEQDVSLMSATEAEGAVASVVANYQFVLQGQGLSLTLPGVDMTSSQSSADVARGAMAAANPWAWPLEIMSQHNETEKLSLAFNDLKVKDAVRAALDTHNFAAVDPVSANIAFDGTKGAYVVTPEEIGTKLQTEAVVDAALKEVFSLSETLTVTDEFLVKPEIAASDARLTESVNSANAMVAANFALMMGKDTAAEVNASLVSQWIMLGEDFSVTFDEAPLVAWVNDLAKACTTVGTTRTATRPDGKEFTVSGGIYGWEVKTDELLAQVKEGVAQGRMDPLEIPCGAKGDAYYGAGKQDWGNRYMDVDLSEQHARFYDESSALIWESDIVTGKPDGEHDTPAGVYWVNRKSSPSVLNGYQGNTNTYNTEVQYWMPFVGDAVGFHDAEWQEAFGGTRYMDGFGSHGCINLPPDKAQELYNILVEADTVVVHW